MNKKHLGLFAAFGAVALLNTTGCAMAIAGSITAPAELRNRQASGNALIEAFFELLSKTGSPTNVLQITPTQIREGISLVRPFLDPVFQLQRADGSRYTALNYIPLDIDEFQIHDTSTTEPRPGIKVIRFGISTPGAVNPQSGMLYSDRIEPRLNVWRWNQELNRWQVVSHANFNTPTMAICNQKPVKMSASPDHTSNQDKALGKRLTRQWFDLLIAGDGGPLMDPQIQAQTASGEGYTTAEQYRKGKLKAVDLSDYEITRNGELLVVSVAAQAIGTRFGGTTELSNRKTPRLLTFLKNEKSEWKLIAVATFNAPVVIPSTLKCVTD